MVIYISIQITNTLYHMNYLAFTKKQEKILNFLCITCNIVTELFILYNYSWNYLWNYNIVIIFILFLPNEPQYIIYAQCIHKK